MSNDIESLRKPLDYSAEEKSPLEEMPPFEKHREQIESEDNEFPFPKDEDILAKMDTSRRLWSFEMDDIDQKIRTERLTKDGKPIFLYRRKVASKQVGSNSFRIGSQYFVLDETGDIIGRVPVEIVRPDTLSMDYWLKEGHQGQGIGTAVLEEIVRQVYGNGEYDGRDCSTASSPGTTSIQNIILEISDDNLPSIGVATKNGFKKGSDGLHRLRREDYAANNK